MDGPLYCITDWAMFFENNRTRELKHMDWVPIPNQMDGDGYTELLDHPDGAAHFGAWIALVEVASRCKPRGTLLRDGAIPHNSGSLSRITRIRREVFDSAIPRLLRIGWVSMEVVSFKEDTEIPQGGAGSSAQSRRALRESDYGTERNGTEEKESTPAAGVLSSGDGQPHVGAEPVGFARWWTSWPKHDRKVGKAKCKREWDRKKLEPIAEMVIRALSLAKASAGWREQQGKFIPMPMTWLNQTPWETDPAEMVGPLPDGDDRDSPGFERAEVTDEVARLALGLRDDQEVPR